MTYKKIILLICCILLTGCIRPKILDEIGIINARGTDIDDQGQIKINLIIFQFEAQSTNITNRVTGKGKTVKGAIKNANYETNFLLEPGKIQVDLYGKDTAKKGISPYLDTLNRDPNTPDTFFIAISNTTAEDILAVQEKDISMNIGQYLHDVITRNSSDHLFPKVTLQRFMSDMKDVGRDPILPVFEIIGNKPKITAIAVLKDDKYVGELDLDNQNLFNIMKGRMKEEWLEVSVPLKAFNVESNEEASRKDNELDLAFNILENKGKTTLTNKENLEFETKITLDLNLLEKSVPESIKLEEEKIIKMLEKEVEKKLTSRYEELLRQLQEFEVDPIGYGEVYRANHREGRLTREEWLEKIPQFKVNFNIDVNIISHGESV